MKVVLVLSYNNRWMVIVTIRTRNTVCHAPYQPQAKLFFNKWLTSRVWPDFRIILSNRKSVFTLLAANRICYKTGLNVGTKTRSIAFQFVLQQYCKTSRCTFFLPIINKFTVQGTNLGHLVFPLQRPGAHHSLHTQRVLLTNKNVGKN